MEFTNEGYPTPMYLVQGDKKTGPVDKGTGILTIVTPLIQHSENHAGGTAKSYYLLQEEPLVPQDQ